MTADALAKFLYEVLKEVEWAGTAWTDYAACPFCHRLRVGASFVNPPEVYSPLTHEDDCQWKAAMKAYKEWRA